MLTVVDDGVLARQRVADDPDVLTRACERLAERPPVPPLDHLRAAHTDPETRSPFREPVEGHGVHRHRRRCPRGHLRDPGAEAQARRRGRDRGKRGEGVRAPRLAGPDRVEAELLHEHGALDELACRTGISGPVAELESELQVAGHEADGTRCASGLALRRGRLVDSRSHGSHTGHRRDRALRLPEGTAPQRGAAPRARDATVPRRRGHREVRDRRVRQRERGRDDGRRSRDDGRVPADRPSLHRRDDDRGLVVRVPRAAPRLGDPRRALRHGSRHLRVGPAARGWAASSAPAGSSAAAGRCPGPMQFEAPYGGSLVGSYAMHAMRHMHEFGTTSEQLAEIAVGVREYATPQPERDLPRSDHGRRRGERAG